MDPMRPKLVYGERVFAFDQAKVRTFDECEPGTAFAADRTVAADRALAQIHVGFVTNRATMTAACVGFLHKSFSRMGGSRTSLHRAYRHSLAKLYTGRSSPSSLQDDR